MKYSASSSIVILSAFTVLAVVYKSKSGRLNRCPVVTNQNIWFTGQCTSEHFNTQEQNCWNSWDDQMKNFSARTWAAATRNDVQRFGFFTAAAGVSSNFSLRFRIARVQLRSLGSKWQRVLSASCCIFFRFSFSSRNDGASAEGFKAGGAHRKEFLDWLKSLSALKLRGQRAAPLKENRHESSYPMKIILLWLWCVCEPALFEAQRSRRCSVAWLEPRRARRPMRADVLVVVTGSMCRHPGSAACWRDNSRWGGRESDHPPACGRASAQLADKWSLSQ